MRVLHVLFVFIIMGTTCYGQVKPVPTDLMPKAFNQEAISRDYARYNDKAFDLTICLPDGYDVKGRVDYTKELQQGIDEHSIVVLPDFPILVNDKGLTLRDNTVLLFQTSSKLILAPTSKDTYDILRIHNVENVKVYNANIEGDAKNHKGKTGEWGMGIAIRTSRDVMIYNARIQNCWGDGIYVGTLVEKVNGRGRWIGPSHNIEIYNSYVNGNRRNGLSLVSVKGCKVYNSLFANTRGTFPKSGIDIEPFNFAGDIEIKNVVTFNNGQDGIVIALAPIVKSKIQDHEVSILIDNHQDVSSSMGLRLSGHRDTKSFSIDGQVTISNSSWSDNPYGSLVIEPGQNVGPHIKFVGNNAGQRKSRMVLKGNAIRNLPSVKKGLVGNHSIVFQ